MSYSLKIIEPGEAVVTLSEFKLHAGINTDRLDPILADYLAAAVDEFERTTGRAVSATGFRQQVSHLCGPLHLMTADVLSVDKIAYYDADDALVELEADEGVIEGWTWDAEAVPCPLYRQDGVYPSANASRMYPAYVEFTAGFSTCPARVKTALLMFATHLYRNRQSVITGTITAEIPLGWRAACDLYFTGLYGSWRN